MKKYYSFALLFGTVCIMLFISSCTNSQKSNENSDIVKPLSSEDVVKRGEYLVTIMGCHDCHSPKKMGPNGPELIPELLLSGAPSNTPNIKYDTTWTNKGFAIMFPDLTSFAGPWGISYAANLTPDQTGIGTWTEEQFKRAMKEGKFKGLEGGRMLLPPMPWFNFVDIKDEDVHAVFAYLKSIKPVENVVPAPVPPDEM